MKLTALLTLALLFSRTVYAAPYALRCSSDPPTNSIAVEEVGDEVRATIFLGYGAKYAPAMGGVFTPGDLPGLTEKARLASNLKTQMTFHWPKKKCEFPADGRIECWGTDDVQEGEGGAKFAPFAVYSTNITEQGIAGKQEMTRITLALYSENKSLDLKFEYSTRDCWH